MVKAKKIKSEVIEVKKLEPTKTAEVLDIKENTEVKEEIKDPPKESVLEKVKDKVEEIASPPSLPEKKKRTRRFWKKPTKSDEVIMNNVASSLDVKSKVPHGAIAVVIILTLVGIIIYKRDFIISKYIEFKEDRLVKQFEKEGIESVKRR